VYSTDYAARGRRRSHGGVISKLIEVYDGDKLKLREGPARARRRALVVGHSDTTPELVQLLGGESGSPSRPTNTIDCTSSLFPRTESVDDSLRFEEYKMRTIGSSSPPSCFPARLSGAGSCNDYVEDPANVKVDPSLLSALKFRDVGFSRGGRSTAVTGVPGQPLVYYFGGTGGGVFKTADAGNSWTSVTDGFLGVGAIGAVAVAPSDPNVLYVGTGSACRAGVSVGDGV
jgi:hypothetical protein